MRISFYILMGILALLSATNLIIAKRQKESRPRTIGVWFNTTALLLITTAITISLLK